MDLSYKELLLGWIEATIEDPTLSQPAPVLRSWPLKEFSILNLIKALRDSKLAYELKQIKKLADAPIGF